MNFLKITGAVATLMLGLTACENVDEADRLIEVEHKQSDKVILVEEFTGAKCVNCPRGAETVAALHEAYGDQIVAVSLYPEQLASLTMPFDDEYDLRTSVATELFSSYDGTKFGLPCAMFDRTAVGNSVLNNNTQTWGADFLSLLNSTASPLNITLTPTYDEATRTLKIDYNLDFIQGVPQALTMQLYIIENGIITWQVTPNGLDRNYVNNHVLRTALYGTWGTEIGSGFAPGTQHNGSATTTLDANWDAANCQVVGFVSGEGRRVLQTAIANI